MRTLHESYPGMVAALADRYGRLSPFADDADPFTRILAQLVDPRKAPTILNALREANLLDPTALAQADLDAVSEAVRDAGASLPAPGFAPMQRLARWLVDDHGGSAEALDTIPTERLRQELVGIRGVGPASADAILLFALRRPVYPVDRASYRVLVRHGWLDPTADYEEARDVLGGLSPDDAEPLAHLSAWLERVGREACRVTVAKCERCPLAPFLPLNGPVSP